MKDRKRSFKKEAEVYYYYYYYYYITQGNETLLPNWEKESW